MGTEILANASALTAIIVKDRRDRKSEVLNSVSLKVLCRKQILKKISLTISPSLVSEKNIKNVIFGIIMFTDWTQIQYQNFLRNGCFHLDYGMNMDFRLQSKCRHDFFPYSFAL